MSTSTLIDYAKRLGIDTNKSASDSGIDIEKGKAGYNQYLADSEGERAIVAKADEYANAPKWWEFGKFVEQGKKWWEGLIPTNDDGTINVNAKQQQAEIASEATKLRHERPSDNWTQDEKWQFGILYGENKDRAYEYAKQLNDDYARGKKAEKLEPLNEFIDKNPLNATVASVGSLGLKAVGGLADLTGSVFQMAAHGNVYERSNPSISDIGTAAQSRVAENLNDIGTINDDAFIFGGKGLGDLYGVGMSIAQTVVLSPTGKIGTLASYFGMAASNGISDALSRGATSSQALKLGLIYGAAEAIPEMLQMEKLVGLASKEAVENVFKSVLKMAGSEAAEELTTSLISEIADRWIMGEKSNYQLLVNNLVANGMGPKQAQTKAFVKIIGDIAYDTIAGAASGAVSGAGAIAVGRFNQKYLQVEANQKAKETLGPESKKLIEEGKKYESTKNRASALEKKISEGKEPTGYELRMLATQINDASRSADIDTVRKAIIDKMKSEGVSEGKVERLAEIALNKAIGNEVSKVQDVMLNRDASAMKVYNQMSEDMMKSGLGDSAWAENTPLEKLRAEKRASEQTSTEKRVHSGIERLKADIAAKYGVDTPEYKINMASIEGKFGEIENKIVYKPGENSKIHVDGISSSLTQDDIIELAAIEKIANELGIDIHVYETTVDNNGERSYVDKSGKRTSDSGYYDPNDNSIHIDLRAGENGEGTMLYTASHEVVHFIKENAPEHYEALETLVAKALIEGGYSIETLLEDQKNKLIDSEKQKLIEEGVDPNTMSAEAFDNLARERIGETNLENIAREEMIAEACQSFLTSKSAVAEIKALKTKNKGLWSALKKFFTSWFNKINKVYKTVPPDSAEGKYIASMRKAVKPICDAFLEGAVESSKNAASGSKTEAKTTENKVMRSQARIAEEKYNKATANTEILNLVSNVSNGSFEQQDKVYFGTVTTSVAEEIKSITGIDVTGYRMAVEARQISHILKDHGKTGITDHSMADNNDIAKMEYAMRNPDEISYGGKTRAYSTIRNGKNRTADTVLYEKVIGEKSYYVVQATPDTKAKTLYVVTAFIGKSGYKNKMEAPQLANVKNLGVTSEIGSVVTSNDSISQPAEKVNDKSKIRSKSRSTVTAEQDSAYLEAVKRGDTETAQKMVEEAAKANGYTVKGYHATNAEFNVFDISKTSDINYHGRGIYFTNSKRDVENNYENYEGPDPWQKIEAAAYELLYDKYNLSYEDTLTSDSEIIDKLNECYDEVIDKFKKTLRRVTAYLKFDNPLIIGKGERASDYDLSKYDGIIDKHVYENIGQGGMDENTVHYVVLNPSNIKSSDPVTYDDNGNVIPLSERFNEKSKDIRHKVRNIVGKSGKNYGKGVYLDSTLLTGLTDEERVQMVKEYIKELGGSVFTAYDDKNKLVDIHIVESNKKFKNEKGRRVYVNQHLTDYLKNPTKQEAITLIDELIVTANYTKSENARHKHGWLDNDGKNTWDVWTTYLQDKENTVWKANLQIANSVNGEKILYEIHPIEKVEEVGKPDTTTTAISISQTPEVVNPENKIRSKSRTRTYSQGQAAAMKANLSHQKVYTKSTAMKFVKAVAPGIKTKAFDELSNELWIGLNTYTSLEDKQAFAKDMADMLVERILVDTEVKNAKWDEAVEKIAYLKPAINTIKFREEDLPNLEHMLDKSGLRSLRARWGYKSSSKEGIQRRPYGLDEFITDLSREMPGMSYLADMHPTEV